MAGALSLLRNLTPRGRLKLGGAVLGALIALVLLFKVAGHTSYETLMAGIDTSQTSKITGALDSAGVSYKLGSGGTEISVDPKQYSQARIALAGQGLDTGTASQPGFELFDKQKLGASDFQQQVTYQRALEGQIAQTVEGIEGVGTAQVQLVIPQDQLFTTGSQKATAAVLLSGSGDALAPGAVQGIANLVASSVKGLTTRNVTITDGSGAMLWPSSANGGTNPTNTPTAKITAQNAYESTLDAQLASMLAATVGPDKARVQTNVVLDTNQAARTRCATRPRAFRPRPPRTSRPSKARTPAWRGQRRVGQCHRLRDDRQQRRQHHRLQAHDGLDGLRRQQDRHPHQRRPRQRPAPQRRADARQQRAQGAGRRHQGVGGQRRRPRPLARRHDLRDPAAVRQAARDDGQDRPAGQPAGTAKYALLGLGTVLFCSS